jgi:hypothetical protein
MFGWFLVDRTGSASDGLWLGGICVAELTCGVFVVRAARLNFMARANGEPMLVLTNDTLIIRDSFFWREHRFGWNQVLGINAVEKGRLAAISIVGDLKPLGSRFLAELDEPLSHVENKLRRAGYLPR